MKLTKTDLVDSTVTSIVAPQSETKKKGQVGHACGDTDMMASLRKNFLPNANSPFQLAKANAQAVSIWK